MTEGGPYDAAHPRCLIHAASAAGPGGGRDCRALFEVTPEPIGAFTREGIHLVQLTGLRSCAAGPSSGGFSLIERLRYTGPAMEPSRPYRREHYRVPLPITYPVMFSDATTIGEGTITNLSVFGCTMECSNVMPEQTTLLLRLILPDQKESLPIEQAEVRWVRGRQVGLRFDQLARTANLRLHVFVWDRMLERLQRLKEQGALNPCS